MAKRHLDSSSSTPTILQDRLVKTSTNCDTVTMKSKKDKDLTSENLHKKRSLFFSFKRQAAMSLPRLHFKTAQHSDNKLKGEASTDEHPSAKCVISSSVSQPCLSVLNSEPTRILPFLFLGSQADALSQEILNKNHIKYIVNVSTTSPKPDHIPESNFLRIPVNDSHNDKLLPYFTEAFQFLDKVSESNSCVLVHCLAGISRSPTLVIAYIMRCLNLSSDEAYRYVKEKRPTISPNFNFLGQLLDFESETVEKRRTSSFDPDTLCAKRRCTEQQRVMFRHRASLAEKSISEL